MILNEYFFLFLFWTLWCLIHSVLASEKVIQYIKFRFNSLFLFYRLLYNIIAIASLIPLCLYESSIRMHPLFIWGDFNIIRIGSLVFAAFIIYFGVKQYNILQFLGVRQLNSRPLNKEMTGDGRFRTTGILSVIRHPWYLALILLIWVGHSAIYISTLIINTILSTYILIGAILEENKLQSKYGEEYSNYKKEVSMFIPFKFLKSKIV